jgi:DNA polymerase-1
MKVLFLDAYNLIHRARSGFTRGEYAVVFNFFRGVRPLVEKFSPDKVYFVLEGNPKFRNDLLDGEYKAGRVNPGNHFHRQKAIIINMVKSFFPFTTVKHPDFECDDVIATYVAKHAENGDDCTIVSSDSDFIQLYNAFENLKIYNPVKKSFVEKPEYDYVIWKALRGDKTDAISGIPGVGDKTATKIISNPELLKETLRDNIKRQIFERNVNLIRLVDLRSRINEIEITENNVFDTEEIFGAFNDFQFDSMTKEKTWNKYVETFIPLTK